MAKMFESKNTELYTAKDTLQDVEPSTLTEFGQNVSDNLTVLGNRISSIMSGSSDDSWDDKVKTQITSAIEKIGNSVKEEQKTAEVVKRASSILSTLKSALEEYVLGFDSWEIHVNSEPKEKTETYTEEGSTEPKTRYTQKYLDWQKEDATLRKTVPELEEQAETWMEQMKTYFEAYNFETHEINTTIYKENKNPLKFYGDLYKQYESEYVPQEEEENVVPAVIETPPIEETKDPGSTAKKINPEQVIEALGTILVNGEITNEEDAKEKLREEGYTEEEIQRIMEQQLWKKKEAVEEESQKEETIPETEAATIPFEFSGTEVTGDDLEEFRSKYCVKGDADVTVLSSTLDINGVSMEVFYVFGDDVDKNKMERFVASSTENIGKIDGNVLSQLTDNGTKIVYLDSPHTSTYDAEIGGLYYYSKFVQIPFYENENSWGDLHEAVIHELGHAIDHQAAGSLTDKSLSYVTASDIEKTPGLANYFATGDDGSINLWDDVISEECAGLFPCSTPEETAQNVVNTRNTPSEYVAEATKRYFRSEQSREELAFVAPKTYANLQVIYGKMGVGNEN